MEELKCNEKYFKKIIGARDGKIDTYSVGYTFGLTIGRHHAVKKILCAGNRGAKTELQDLQEAIVAIEREIEILTEKKNRVTFWNKIKKLFVR